MDVHDGRHAFISLCHIVKVSRLMERGVHRIRNIQQGEGFVSMVAQESVSSVEFLPYALEIF